MSYHCSLGSNIPASAETILNGEVTFTATSKETNGAWHWFLVVVASVLYYCIVFPERTLIIEWSVLAGSCKAGK